ncbi:MAG TPA: serine hydrolase domain-containing protein, partial [Egibacteraceae bacterium]
MPTSRLTAATVTLCVAVVVVLTAAPAAAAQEQAPAIDPAALRTFVDGFFTAAVVEEPVPGVAVSAVQGGRTILSAGYGVPEAGGTQEVDPRRTRFRVGELSQVATAVAALQLVETGQLELNVDVNRW